MPPSSLQNSTKPNTTRTVSTGLTIDKQEVEDLGAFFERRGMTLMEARVFALLLVAEPHYQDFYTIQEVLAASKSSISNALNRLMASKRVDYLTLPGDRKRYFKVNPELWLEEMKAEIASVVPMMDRIDAIVKRRQGMNTPEFNRGLSRIHAFFTFMVQEFPKLLARWDKQDPSK